MNLYFFGKKEYFFLKKWTTSSVASVGAMKVYLRKSSKVSALVYYSQQKKHRNTQQSVPSIFLTYPEILKSQCPSMFLTYSHCIEDFIAYIS